MRAFTILAISLIAFAGTTRAYLGVDLSTASNSFACMKSSGMHFAIARGYMSYGAVDTNAVTTLKNAKAAGLITDVYHFPCLSVSATQQANDLMHAMKDSNGHDLYGTVWVDVEFNPTSKCAWSSNTATNCSFLGSLVNAYKNAGKIVGIYASRYQWQSIFGSFTACSQFAHLPLWYPHYDNVQSFSDWTTFGGWAKPAIKQYQGTTTLCGTGVDMNFY